MGCFQCKNWLHRSWLDLPRPAEVRKHLVACPACRAECAGIAHVSNLLEGMPLTNPSALLRARVLNSVLANRPTVLMPQIKKKPKPSKVAHGRTALSMALCLLLCAVGLDQPSEELPQSGSSFAIPSSQQPNPAINIPSAWPAKEGAIWTTKLEVESKRALDVAYRCLRPAAEVSWTTMSKAIREAAGPFSLNIGS